MQSFITKQVKKAPESIPNLVKLAIDTFLGKGFEVVEADVVKNIKELENKAYIEVNEEQVKYLAE